ncbi:MAG: hypothetical protein ACLU8F_06685 [Clostridia bacterium]
MKKKILSIIIVVFIIIMSIVTYNFITNNDDFAPYTNKEYDEFYDINSDIYDLALIKYELTPLAQKYEKGVKLTYAQYDIKDNSKTAEFQFYNDDYNGKNEACIVTILVDIDEKKTTKIKYERGHGKRVLGHSLEITTSEKVSDYINPKENIKVAIANEGISLYKDEKKIATEDFIKNISNNLGDKYEYEGIITEINSDNIIFENQSNNKKYLIKLNRNFKFINGRTNEEINVSDIKVGNYIDTYPYTEESKVIGILSNIKGEELRKELIKNLSLEHPIDSKTQTNVRGKNMNIINNNKAILTLIFKESVESQNINSEEFEIQVEINSNTTIECKGGYNKIEQLGDVLIDVINVRLDENTIKNEIPVATWFMSSNGN